MVISVTSTNMQVQNQRGVTAASIGAKTHVIRVVNGSMTDVVSGAMVELRTRQGSSSIVGIYISADSDPAKHTEKSPVPHRNKSRIGAPSRNLTPHIGAVVSVSSVSITIQSPQGQRATYPLDPNVLVIKDITGHTTDLAVGQMVQMQLGRGNYATYIQILNA